MTGFEVEPRGGGRSLMTSHDIYQEGVPSHPTFVEGPGASYLRKQSLINTPLMTLRTDDGDTALSRRHDAPATVHDLHHTDQPRLGL